MPLDIYKALQRSGITFMSAISVDKPVFKGPAKAGVDSVVSDKPQASSADDTKTLSGRFCGEEAHGVLGSTCSWLLKGFGIVCNKMFGERAKLVKLSLDSLELL
jgi:hypothetical protein